MKITNRWLKKNKACADGKAWVLAQDTDDAETLIRRLLEENNLVWANWFLPRCLTRANRLKYGVYVAESVIGLFEKNYPNDNRPRLAIDAVKKVLEKNTGENRLSALTAARSAEEAAACVEVSVSISAAAAAAYSAAWCVAAAAYSAAAYSAAAYSATWCAASARSAAWSACSPEDMARFRRTAEYGLALLHEQEL